MYTFSYNKPVTQYVFVKRPWWAFWRHDIVECKETLERFAIHGLTKDEADFIMSSDRNNFMSVGGSVLLKIIGCGGKFMHSVQLEQETKTTPYIEQQE